MVALVWVLAGCQELPRYFAGDTTLAEVGKRQLGAADVASAVPAGVTGEDSAAFVRMFVDRWVRKQLKLQEAEALFSASEKDIDRQVEEYRQALLIRKLEQQVVDRNIDTLFTEADIAAYYAARQTDFLLDRPLVKGLIVRSPEGHRQAARLKTLMQPKASAAQQRTLRDLCEKNGFAVSDFREQWVDFPEFLSYLPAVQSQNHSSMLAADKGGAGGAGEPRVQEMRDSRSHYYFRIDSVRREGDPIPLERVRTTIRRILFNQRQGEVIRRHEAELLRRGLDENRVRILLPGLEQEPVPAEPDGRK